MEYDRLSFLNLSSFYSNYVLRDSFKLRYVGLVPPWKLKWKLTFLRKSFFFVWFLFRQNKQSLVSSTSENRCSPLKLPTCYDAISLNIFSSKVYENLTRGTPPFFFPVEQINGKKLEYTASLKNLYRNRSKS